MDTNGHKWKRIAERNRMPLRTLAQVRKALDAASKTNADAAMARLMLRHGRLAPEARAFVAQNYPQAA